MPGLRPCRSMLRVSGWYPPAPWPHAMAASPMPALRPNLPADLLRDAETIDCEGRLITPGLIDCHTHLVHAGNRANEFEMRLAGATYEEVAKAGGGIVSSVKALRAASEDELVRQSLPRLDALICRRGHDDRDQVRLRARPRERGEVAARGAPAGDRTERYGTHQLPRRACAAAGSQGRQGRLHRSRRQRDAAGDRRVRTGRRGRRLLRGHRLLAGADFSRVRQGARRSACR